MGTLGEISDAINLIQVKKENLRKSFLHLQSQSSDCTLEWDDFDSYFTTITASINHSFNLLQTLHPSSDSTSPLKSFCLNSDGLGLRHFLINVQHRSSVVTQLPDAYRCAPDAAAMVLDAMAGFYSDDSPLAESRRLVKSVCVSMLEGLIRVKPDVTVELRDKAMNVAVQWNRQWMNGPGKDKKDNAVGFLLLVGAYGLVDRFSMDDLIECIVIVSRRRRTLDFTKLIPADKIKDLIQELINRDMHVAAAKFSIEFEKTDEFPPVGLLAERVLLSKRNVEEIRKNGGPRKVCNMVMVKEVGTLRSVIKCIDEFGLESEYPKDSVVALVKELEDEIGSKKQAARRPPVAKKQLSTPKKPKPNNFVESGVQNLIPVQQPPHSRELLVEPAGSAPIAIGSSGLTGNPMATGGGSGLYLPQSYPPSASGSRPGYYSNWNGGYEHQAPYFPH